MYKKKSKGWYKHKDFIFIDLLCVIVSFVLANWIRHGCIQNLYTDQIYRDTAIFLLLSDFCICIIFESYKGVLRRGYYLEFVAVVKQTIILELVVGSYLFSVRYGHVFSRSVFYLLGCFYLAFTFLSRIMWKRHLKTKMIERGEHSLYIITTQNVAENVITKIKENNYDRYNINGLVIVDCDMTGQQISGIPVVSNLKNAASYICQQWVDEVLVHVKEDQEYPRKLVDELLEMGMVVHMSLTRIEGTPGRKQFVEKVGGYTVLTSTMNYSTNRQAIAKRALDIAGGLVGCLLTGFIILFVGPGIYLASPGPIFFTQTRIGQNGKPFKMYKFRSMYMDAEKRKTELMAQNKMSDSRMFKLDFDPRVIGNKMLPDGTKKTGIGEFIRKTSLDEFPQFWNVLKGEMSLVGTRPILVDELRQYELHHRTRIAIKPGITGMWQVNGRSDITDFEEVVQLDKSYIENWTIGLDIKILLQTVKAVLKKEGSV